MIDLAPSHLRTVRQLLADLAPECEVRVFGSRVAGNAKPYSDLDIVLIGGRRLPSVRVSAVIGTEMVALPLASTTAVPVSAPPVTSAADRPDRV